MALRTFTLFVFLLAAAATVSAQTFVFDLRGNQEVPPVPSTASGGCMGQLDQPGATFTLTCVHNVTGPTLMHIHQGPAGTNGGVVFDMGDPASPVTATWTSMTPTNIADLLAGDLYLNIHTAGRPAGEIRGQIVNAIDAVAFTADGPQVVPPNASLATGSCTADLNAGATSLAVNCTHNLAAPDVATVNDAPFGENGAVVHPFPSAASPLSGSIPMTPLLVAKYAATFLSLQIQQAGGTEESPSDAIRGQLGTPPAGAGTGTIIIEKETAPSGGTGFGFTDTITAPNSFSLDDGGTRTFSFVAPGTYTVTEDDPSGSGSTVADISCDDGDSTGNPFTRTATVNLQAGEAVTCTFTNFQTVASPTLFVFHLSADQEVPANGSTARGGCYAQLNPGTSEFSIVCTHDVSSPTVVHIHRGPAGTNGPVVFDLGDPISPIIATWPMTPADVADLEAGNLYLNIHASGRPAGEIRGQILPRTVDSFSFAPSGSQEVPPTDSPATGNCSADLATDATSVRVDCTHGVAAPTMIHLHDAPPGSNGPIVFTFPTSTTFGSDVPLTPRLVADFAAGFLYVNIHSAGYEEGEIRGQLIAGAAATTLAAVPTLGEWAALLMLLSIAALAVWRMR